MVHVPMFEESVAPMSDLDYMNAAAESVRAYCGWHVTPVRTETLVVDDDGTGTVLLPSGRVTDVLSVARDGAALDLAEVQWNEDGVLRFPARCGRGRLRGLAVEVTHGYTEAEAAAVLGVIRGVATRAAMSPGGNIVSQSAGTQRVSYASSGGAVASLPLMQTEKDVLATFRLGWGPR